jgi:thiol-disulfide isomerase/thioredoxin
MDGGLAASIGSPIVDGAVRTLSNSFALTGNTVLQDFDHLSVVAVLFNTATGTIVNADIQPVVVAEDFAVNKMQVGKFDPVAVVKGTTADILIPVANYGRAGIHSIDYLVRSGGVDSEELHIDLQTPITTFGLYTPIDFKIKVPEETGVSSQTFVITKLNGSDNEATSGKTSTGSIITVAKASKRKTVVEEFTGTWCPWCPRGMAGLKRTQDEYPDDAVLIAIHGGRSTEPMHIATFNNQINSISGYPSAHVNRYLSCDPYMGTGSDGWGLGAVIENENSKMVEASVELHQPTMEQSTGVINFTTDVTFQLNRTNAPYLLSYVLVADGLTGTGDDWTQVNAYAAYYYGAYGDEDPYMREICDEWDVYQSGLAFNHVGIAALGIDNGVTGSLKTTVEEGQVQTHTGRIATKNNKLAKLATKMRVIALLYDKNRKTFINADQKEVLVTDAVEDLDEQAESSETARYAIDGKQLTRPTRGINIVRMADGSVHKVLVK